MQRVIYPTLFHLEFRDDPKDLIDISLPRGTEDPRLILCVIISKKKKSKLHDQGIATSRKDYRIIDRGIGPVKTEKHKKENCIVCFM